DQIQWGGLTHVIYAWALVQPNGTLDLDTQQVAANAPALVAAAHAHGVKALLGVGQPFWLGQTGNLQQAANSYRSTLTSNIMSVVNTYGFDGVDIDWRPFNTGTDGPASSLLGADLRALLGSRILTASAIVTDSAYWGTAYKVFDRVHIITYALTGTWNPYSWHNAALYDPDNQVWSVDLAVRRFTQAGVPASTLTIGIPFFGFMWTGGGITGPQQYWSGTPTITEQTYQALAPSINSGAYRQDSLARVPYLTSSGSFLTYDDEWSIKQKMDYVAEQGIGGWTIWELSGDYLPSQSPNQPLLASIMSNMGKTTPPDNPRVPTPPTVTINKASGQQDPTSRTPIHFTVVFSEPVTGFTAGDVTVSGSAGGPMNVVLTGSGANYDVAISGMTSSGNVTASIGAGVATDAEGDPNSASTSNDNTVRYRYRR
ncbi:MAG TPA: glycosyl hydrolase family 18 protein, partial [Terriglobia bacterium]|nr:glycosyl hydrolase family 18 protein [Terriglobia bacterium]